MAHSRTEAMKAALTRKGTTNEQESRGPGSFAADLRCCGGWFGSDGRVGGQTARGGGAESSVARGGPRGEPEGVYRARARVQAQIPGPLAGTCADPARAKAVLRVDGVALRGVRQ